MYGKYDLGKKVQSFEVSPESETYLGVIVYLSEDETIYTDSTDTDTDEDEILYGSYGDLSDSSRVLELTAPICTSTEEADKIAKNIYNSIKNKQYVPFSAGNADLPPIYGLGDSVTIDDTTAIIAKQSLKLDSMNVSDISAPSEEDIDNEIEYVSQTNRKIQRQFSNQKADYISRLNIATDEIQAYVGEIYDNVQHDYCVNGDFSNGLTEWNNVDTNETATVSVETISGSKWAVLSCSSDEIAMLYQTVVLGTGGSFKLRFKAYTDSEYITTVGITIELINKSSKKSKVKSVPAGKLTTSPQTFEFEYSDVPEGETELTFYPTAYSSKVYITDIELLGYITGYAESQITITADSITAEVTARKEADEKLVTSYTTLINQTAETIQASVSSISEKLQHDYCVNGNFEMVTSSLRGGGYYGWETSSSSSVTDVIKDGNGTYFAVLRRSAGTNCYIKQSMTVGSIDSIKIRFKALTYTPDLEPSIDCVFNSTGKGTAAGEITANCKTFEFEFDFENVVTGDTELYLWSGTNDSIVLITDVEVISELASHVEAMIQINADSIKSCVTKDEFGTLLQQSANDVILAFNAYSNYVQISSDTNGAYISLYNGTVKDSELRATFDQQGTHFWRDSYEVGWIGTSVWTDDTSHKGLAFNLEPKGKYMTWGVFPEDDEELDILNITDYDWDNPYYASVLTFSKANSIYDEYGLHVSCPMYTYQPINTKGLFIATFLTIYNDVDINFYSDLNMNNFSILNNSDERLKENIVIPDVDPLEIINDIELKQFDWRESGEHVDLGMIAQQVKDVLPEAVSQNSKTGLYSLRVEKFIPYLIGAVQELSGNRKRKSDKYKPNVYTDDEIKKALEFAAPPKHKSVTFEKQEQVTAEEHKPKKTVVKMTKDGRAYREEV